MQQFCPQIFPKPPTLEQFIALSLFALAIKMHLSEEYLAAGVSMATDDVFKR